MQAIALLSSGLDSSLALTLAIEQGYRFAFALTYDYGQRSAVREMAAAAAIAAHFKIPHRTLALPWFREMKGGGSLLRRDADLPKPSASDLDAPEFGVRSAKAVWVPNRNGVFLEIGAALAENEGASALVVGFNAEEAKSFPDNSVPYMEAITRALFFSTMNHVQVVSPTAPLSKAEIVREGMRVGFPFPLLWSCYEAATRMCGRCESCMRLKRALAANGISLEESFADSSLHR